MDSDSPWNDSTDEHDRRESDWTKISTEFTNASLSKQSLIELTWKQAGYREGITAGKESALQEGFDAGFVVGAPIGRELGILRGISMGLLSFLTTSGEEESRVNVTRDIVSNLGKIRLSDLAPRDLEAEEHARQHFEDENLAEKRKMEELEDMLAQLNSPSAGRPSRQDMDRLKANLQAVCENMGYKVELSADGP